MAMSSDKTTRQTTFVQADLSNFRSIVQKLTGAPELPLTLAPSPRPTSTKHMFKLHKQSQNKLGTFQLVSRDYWQRHHQYFPHGRSPGHHPTLMVSPVSPLELSGRSSRTPKEKEEKAIAEKGFYFHPVSPLGGGDPPELLPLFPLHSPRDQPDDS